MLLDRSSGARFHDVLLPELNSESFGARCPSTSKALGLSTRCTAVQVVLPLLQNEVVTTGWVSEADFLTGLALVQAMPGPLFNFAAYLGVSQVLLWQLLQAIFAHSHLTVNS